MLQAPFLDRAKAEAKRRDIAIATLSNKLFGEAVTLQRMIDGGSCTVRKFERAQARLAELEAQAVEAKRTSDGEAA